MLYQVENIYYYDLTVNGRVYQINTRHQDKKIASDKELDHYLQVDDDAMEIRGEQSKDPSKRSLYEVVREMRMLLRVASEDKSVFSIYNPFLAQDVAELAAFRERADQYLHQLKSFLPEPDVAASRTLTPDEQTRLLAALRGDHEPSLKLLVPLLLFTGIEVEKALSLTWDCISSGRKTLHVVGQGLHVERIPLSHFVWTALTEYRSWFRNYFGEPEPIDFVFRIHINDLVASWIQLIEEAGIDCRLDDLRTTYLAGLAKADVSVSEAVTQDGH